MTAVFLTALAVSALGMFFVLPLLKRAQVMDVPNARSSHAYVTPRGGGASVLLGILLAIATGQAIGLHPNAWVTASMLLFGILGFLDDLGDLSVAIRLVVQFGVAGVLAFVTIGAGIPGSIWIVIGSIWLVGYTNAFNFMDGINAISSTNAVIAGLWYAGLGHATSQESLTLLGLAVAGGALGFLPWNAPVARVFLGDVGSYGLGSVIGWLALASWVNGSEPLLAAAPLLLYLVDTSVTLILRIMKGQAWHEAHRAHAYQRLVAAGLPHVTVSFLTAAIAGAVGAGAVLIHFGEGVIGGLLMALPIVAYMTSPKLIRQRDEFNLNTRQGGS